ncbi:MAG: hypothetical protein K6L81_01805 [Agarilytica sp.]
MIPQEPNTQQHQSPGEPTQNDPVTFAPNSIKDKRPSNSEIFDSIATNFDVDRLTVVTWLLDISLHDVNEMFEEDAKG